MRQYQPIRILATARPTMVQAQHPNYLPIRVPEHPCEYQTHPQVRNCLGMRHCSRVLAPPLHRREGVSSRNTLPRRSHVHGKALVLTIAMCHLTKHRLHRQAAYLPCLLPLPIQHWLAPPLPRIQTARRSLRRRIVTRPLHPPIIQQRVQRRNTVFITKVYTTSTSPLQTDINGSKSNSIAKRLRRPSRQWPWRSRWSESSYWTF